MTSFQLKNTHRYKAFAFAVQQLENKHTNPIYRRREMLVDEIVSVAWSILKQASAAHDGFKDFLASGLAHNATDLDLAAYAPMLLGRYGMNSSVQIWPAVVASAHAGTLMSFDSKVTSTKTVLGTVVSFRNTNQANLLPVATLQCALDLKIRTADCEQITRQTRLRTAVRELAPAIAAEITDVFVVIPGIADAIASCQSSTDLFAMFPAAEHLFADPAVATVDASTRTVASQILSAL